MDISTDTGKVKGKMHTKEQPGAPTKIPPKDKAWETKLFPRLLNKSPRRNSTGCILDTSFGKIVTLDLTWDDDEGRSIKRKREGLKETVEDTGDIQKPVTNTLVAKAREIMGTMDRTIRELAKVVNDNMNTKK